MSRALVTGAAGLLGGASARAFEAAGYEVAAFSHAYLDVADAAAVARVVADVRPSVVVHCAAMTNVDACETAAAAAWAVNAEGSGNVAAAAASVGAPVIAISSDYVFDGRKGSPYVESDETSPLQEYGRSKAGGEELVRHSNPRHYIVRSAWIYGRGGKNFLSRIFDYAAAGRIRAIVDQRGSPTYAPDLAAALVTLPDADPGTYHVVNAEHATWADIARVVLDSAGAVCDVDEISYRALDPPAPRPTDTRLASERWPFEPLRSWQEAADAFAREMR